MKKILAMITGVLMGAQALYADEAAQAIVREKIKAGALILDVRTREEFAAGNYPGSINIPLQELESRLGELGDKKRPIVVYCRTGRRSGIAREMLLKREFTDVTNGGGLRDMPPPEGAAQGKKGVNQ